MQVKPDDDFLLPFHEDQDIYLSVKGVIPKFPERFWNGSLPFVIDVETEGDGAWAFLKLASEYPGMEGFRIPLDQDVADLRSKGVACLYDSLPVPLSVIVKVRESPAWYSRLLECVIAKLADYTVQVRANGGEVEFTLLLRAHDNPKRHASLTGVLSQDVAEEFFNLETAEEIVD